MKIAKGLLMLAVSLTSLTGFAQEPFVVVVGPVLHVRPTDQPAGTSTAQLIAAKNEFESFQIVVHGGAAGLTNLTVELIAPLTGKGGAIPAENVTIYREEYFNVTRPSNTEYGMELGTWLAWGDWPDALIPTIDPFFQEIRNAFPIDVPAGQNRVAWVDVLVPQGAVPGSYNGAILVAAKGFNITVPINLRVLNIELPSTASHTSLFGDGYSSACRAIYGGDCFRTATEEDGWRLSALYARAFLDNRITITSPHYQPLSSDIQRDYFRRYTLPLLNGTAPTRLPGARLTSFQVDNATSGEIAGWRAEAELQGFADRSFIYACDEPGTDMIRWSNCRQQAEVARQVWPTVPILVTANIRYARQFQATDYINWIVPIVQHMHDKPGQLFEGNQRRDYDEFLTLDPGNRVFHYFACFSHGCGEEQCELPPLSGPDFVDSYFSGWPDYMIDESSSRARAMGWLSFRYETSGELYYAVDLCLARRPLPGTTAWTHQFSFGGNGDGNLLYPGDPAIIGGSSHIPIESIRLKLIRDGYEDFEYLKILAERGRRDQALAIADGLFPTMYTTEQRDIESARLQLINLIEATAN